MAARLPILGPVWRWTSLAEFLHLLGLLLESDIPLSQAVTMAGEGVVDRAVRVNARALVRGLEGGESLATLIERRSYFPEGLGAMLAWAERHDCLPSALHMLAEMFEGRARSQASFSSTVFSVMTVLAILGGIAAVVVGCMVPLIQLINKLSG